MDIHHNTLILVADGRKFLLLRNTGDFSTPTLIIEASGEQENPPTHEQGTDRPGRSASGRDGVHSSMEPTDFHQIEADRFAADVAEILDGWMRSGDIKELIVVAPPRTLAELRKHYTRTVADRLVGEVNKDLTKHPVQEIARILSE